MIETNGSFRVDRGGSWVSSADGCEISVNLYDYPGYRDSYLGFRVFRRQ